MQQRTRSFLPALEGVRGYAFIVVFLVHFYPVEKPTQPWLWPYFLLTGIGWLVVPIFFALSGYLITGILYDTKGRSGYLKTFYARRSLRVFPLYYVSLAIVAGTAWLRHWKCDAGYLSYLVYLQNFTSSGRIFQIGNFVGLGHLWSLAVEEHFYLLWPLVIWLCPDRKSMLCTAYAVLVGCCVLRLCWPLFDLSMHAGYWSTFTRADGIVCGAILALIERGLGLPRVLLHWAKGFAVTGTFLLVLRTAVAGSSIPNDYTDLILMTPLANLVATSILVMLLSTRTHLSRACCLPWICKLGRLSYSMYVFHQLYLDYFSRVLAFQLARYCGGTAALILSGAMAFLLTLLLAKLAYRFIEMPAIRTKEKLKYGPPEDGEKAQIAAFRAA